MKFYHVNIGNYSTITIKSESNPKYIAAAFNDSNGLVGHNGTIYNVKNYLSFYEVSSPDKTTRDRAISLDGLF